MRATSRVSFAASTYPLPRQSGAAVVDTASGYGNLQQLTGGAPVLLSDTTQALLAQCTVTPTKTGKFLLNATTLCQNAQAASGVYDPTYRAHNYALALQDSLGGNFYSRQGTTIIATQIQDQDMEFLTGPNPIGVPITFQVYGLTDSGGVLPAGGPMLVLAAELSAVEMEQ